MYIYLYIILINKTLFNFSIINMIYHIITILILIIILYILLYNSICIENLCSNEQILNIKLNIQSLKGTNLDIYKNDKLIDKLKFNEFKSIEIKDINYYDDIIIKANNLYGYGGFTGDIITSNETIFFTKNIFELTGQKTNNDNTLFNKFSGGKYLGCFRDNINNRVMKYQAPGTHDIESCHNEAVQNQYPYYGLQNGNLCFLGYEYQNGIQMNDNYCNLKCNKNNKEYCGGNAINSVYSSFETPNIIEYGYNLEKKSKNIHPSSKWIWVEKKNTIPDAYIIGNWEFKWTFKPPNITKFCNNPNYYEFNPKGCLNNLNTESCRKTKLSNYIIDKTLCKTQIKLKTEVLEGFLENRILNCLNIIPKKLNRNKLQNDFITNYYDLFKLSCHILNTYDKSSKLNLCSQSNNIYKSNEFINHCKSIPKEKRICPPNISNIEQNVSRNSLNYELLEDKCNKYNYCFDEYSKQSPKCYLPNMDITKFMNLYDDHYFQAIKKTFLVLNYLPNSKKKFNNWYNLLTNLIIVTKNLIYENI